MTTTLEAVLRRERLVVAGAVGVIVALALADHKVPKHIEIAQNLPREDSGKIFKCRLRDPYWERAGRRI